MVMLLDVQRARAVFASRGTGPLEMRVALMFKSPRDSARLVAADFAESLDDGHTGREAVSEIVQRLVAEKVLVRVDVSTPVGDEARLASETHSLALLLQGVAGDLAAMGTWARDHVRVRGEDPAAALTAMRERLVELQHELVEARKAFITDQLESVVPEASGELKLNLGCGAHRVPGWNNIDFVPGTLRLNLSWGLPFADDSAALVYSAHTFEHLDFHTAAPRLAKELCRVTAPGGIVRLAVPDMEAYLHAYASGADSFFAASDQQRPEFGTLTGYATNLAKIMRMAGSATRSGWFFEHKMGYDFDTLADVLKRGGFTRIERRAHGVSAHPSLGAMDEYSEGAGFVYEGVANTLFVEATR